MIVLLPVPYSGTDERNQPIMVVGFHEFESSLYAICVSDEGQMMSVSVPSVRIDWRYDWKTESWYDTGQYEEQDADEEEADDRGEEVSGDVSDVDRAD